jgi:hypothetical protein
MNPEMILFAVVAAGLMIVEIMLIISVRDLTKSIKKLNMETQEKFTFLVDEINKKFKGIINLAVEFSKTKGGKK